MMMAEYGLCKGGVYKSLHRLNLVAKYDGAFKKQCAFTKFPTRYNFEVKVKFLRAMFLVRHITLQRLMNPTVQFIFSFFKQSLLFVQILGL